MKKTLDLKKMISEAEDRAKKNAPISTDKEVVSEALKLQSKLGQADDKTYSSIMKDLKRK